MLQCILMISPNFALCHMNSSHLDAFLNKERSRPMPTIRHCSTFLFFAAKKYRSNQSNLLKGIDSKTVRMQEFSRLQPFFFHTFYTVTKWFEIAGFFSKKYVLNRNHLWPTLFVKIKKL